MGHEIVYCSGCQSQLRTPDFEKGAAFRIEGRSYCKKCAPEDRAADLRRTVDAGHDVPAAGPGPRIPPASTRRMPLARPQGKNAVAVFGGAAVLLIAVVALAVVAGSGSAPPPKPAAP